MQRDESGNMILDRESVEELSHALSTINKRSDGLLHFVNTYRNLTKIPQPNFGFCKVADILANVGNLMNEEIKSHSIELKIHSEPENISFTADDHLIEQVLINLVKNSLQALKGHENGMIKLQSFFNKRGRVTIQVIDNGPGILPEVLEKIFIPFFTTKPSGSGIGLSLSRQILKLHNGSITAQSAPDKETIFTLTF
jgi:two-component system, NtrC family, nitrogen regulation sensor histidine kinase NtrY